MFDGFHCSFTLLFLIYCATCARTSLLPYIFTFTYILCSRCRVVRALKYNTIKFICLKPIKSLSESSLNYYIPGHWDMLNSGTINYFEHFLANFQGSQLSQNSQPEVTGDTLLWSLNWVNVTLTKFLVETVQYWFVLEGNKMWRQHQLFRKPLKVTPQNTSTQTYQPEEHRTELEFALKPWKQLDAL